MPEDTTKPTSDSPSFFRSGVREPVLLTPGLEPGKIVGDFELRTLLGQGGMGQVWEANQLSLSRQVAVKFVRPERVTKHQLELFAREARAGGRLSHSGIVAVYGHGESDGLAWIAMELVPGAWDLRDFLDEVVRMGDVPDGYDRKVAQFVAKVADAVQAAHEAGVIHRDLKPQNILITEGDEPKVTDFGLARIVDEQALSHTGDFAGTYFYMSPEQVAAKRAGLDHRTDIFSLGIVLYEMLSLVRPFQGDTEHQIAEQILVRDPPDPSTIRSRVPRDLALICLKCLEKDRERRYGSMERLSADLRRWLSNESILAKRPSTLRRSLNWAKRHPVVSSLTALGWITGIAIAILLFLYSREQKRTGAARSTGILRMAEAATDRGAILNDSELDEVNRILRDSRDVRNSELQDAGISFAIATEAPLVSDLFYRGLSGWVVNIGVNHAGGLGPSAFLFRSPVVIVDGIKYSSVDAYTVFANSERIDIDPDKLRRPNRFLPFQIPTDLALGKHSVSFQFDAELYPGIQESFVRTHHGDDYGVIHDLLFTDLDWSKTPMWESRLEFGPYEIEVVSAPNVTGIRDDELSPVMLETLTPEGVTLCWRDRSEGTANLGISFQLTAGRIQPLPIEGVLQVVVGDRVLFEDGFASWIQDPRPGESFGSIGVPNWAPDSLSGGITLHWSRKFEVPTDSIFRKLNGKAQIPVIVRIISGATASNSLGKAGFYPINRWYGSFEKEVNLRLRESPLRRGIGWQAFPTEETVAVEQE
jgi:serine/threonine protein kinase